MIRSEIGDKLSLDGMTSMAQSSLGCSEAIISNTRLKFDEDTGAEYQQVYVEDMGWFDRRSGDSVSDSMYFVNEWR